MRLSEINIYPIKSLRGISVDRSGFQRRGLLNDRRWMIVDESNRFLTQREHPKMATLGVEIGEGGLRISGAGEIEVPLEPDTGERATVTVWGSRVSAEIYNGGVNEFFSDALGLKCRLVKMPEETIRPVSRFYRVRNGDHVSFADAYPFLLISEGSLDDLNSRLADPVPMNRFRPNFVVTGAEPFAEDGWREIMIGDLVFHLVKPCARCVMTTIDQQSGNKHGTEPLRTLGKFRLAKRGLGKKILFGQNLISDADEGVVTVGDEVSVSKTKRRPSLLAV